MPVEFKPKPLRDEKDWLLMKQMLASEPKF